MSETTTFKPWNLEKVGDLQGGKNQKHSEVNLNHQVWELLSKYLSNQAVTFILVAHLLSPSGDIGIGLVWDILAQLAASSNVKEFQYSSEVTVQENQTTPPHQELPDTCSLILKL